MLGRGDFSWSEFRGVDKELVGFSIETHGFGAILGLHGFDFAELIG
jgi:hypothetical protein